MQNPNSDETQPHKVPNENEPTPLDETQPHLTEIQRPDQSESLPGRPWKRWLVSGLIVIIVLIGLASLTGMQSGGNISSLKTTLDAEVEAIYQFNLGLQDLQNGLCERARQRFEFVVQLDPTLPELDEKFAQALICSNPIATQTIAPTATLTATPDLRNHEEQFASAQALFIEENWDSLLETLDSLRNNYPDYLTIEVDRLYYLGLRNRGVQRILVEGNLEGGIFDLNRVEQGFGILDSQAEGYRSWARLYINGSSYWGIDWEQAVFYLAQLAPLAPNLWDGSYFTVDRLATAQIEYSYDLVNRGIYFLSIKDWCVAMHNFDYASIYIEFDLTAQPAATNVAGKCEPPPPTQVTVPPAVEQTPTATP